MPSLRGDISQRYALEARGDIKILTDALNKSFEDLGKTIRLAMDSSTKVASSSTQLSNASRQVNTALGKVAKTTQEIATGSREQSRKLETSTKRYVLLQEI